MLRGAQSGFVHTMLQRGWWEAAASGSQQKHLRGGFAGFQDETHSTIYPEKDDAGQRNSTLFSFLIYLTGIKIYA